MNYTMRSDITLRRYKNIGFIPTDTDEIDEHTQPLSNWVNNNTDSHVRVGWRFAGEGYRGGCVVDEKAHMCTRIVSTRRDAEWDGLRVAFKYAKRKLI